MAVLELNHPWVDESQAPLYEAVMPRMATDQEYYDYVVKLEAMTARYKSSVAWVIQVAPMTSVQRKIMSDSQIRRVPSEKIHCACYAFVAKETVLRGIITASLWLSPPHIPIEIFRHRDEAMEFAKAKLREHIVARA